MLLHRWSPSRRLYRAAAGNPKYANAEGKQANGQVHCKTEKEKLQQLAPLLDSTDPLHYAEEQSRTHVVR
jgi:hypothetical protein